MSVESPIFGLTSFMNNPSASIKMLIQFLMQLTKKFHFDL